MRRRARWLGVGGGLILVAVVWVSSVTGDSDHEWAVAERGDLVLTVPITGTLQAVSTTLIGAPLVRGQWEFKIARLVEEGKEVKAGDELVSFDAADRQRELERRRADLDSAAERLEKRRREAVLQEHDEALRLAEAEARERTSQMKAGRPEDLVADKEARLAMLDLEVATEEVVFLRRQKEVRAAAAAAELGALAEEAHRAQLRVAELEDGIARMRVTAPQPGTVIYLTDWQGDKRKVGDTIWYADKLLELPDLDRMAARCEADEEDLARLRAGQKVVLRLDAHPDMGVPGRVRAVRTTLQPKTTQPQLKVVRLEVDLERTDRLRMRPGMRVRGEVEVERMRDVITIPLEAVRVEAGVATVTSRRWGTLSRVPVRLGARAANRIQVVDGLLAGDRVVLHNGGDV